MDTNRITHPETIQRAYRDVAMIDAASQVAVAVGMTKCDGQGRANLA
jgi:hypothetical protein